ncbi:MAG: protoglobin domain-containing protein [Myxococcota bacterium]
MDPVVREQLEYFDYTEADREALTALAPLLEKHADGLVTAFYRHLISFAPTRRLLSDPEVKERLLLKQRRYLLSLSGPVIDADYVRGRRRIGEIHEEIGLAPGWYLGAYALYLSLLTPLIFEEAHDDPVRAERVVTSLQKLLLFDAHIAMETFIQRRERDLEYLNRELASTGHRLARDYERQSSELRRTTERVWAAERLASLGHLVAGLAHEIGTPMGVIQGHAKLLESSVADEKGRWRLETIRQQISRISRIIQSLLHMAQPSGATRSAVDLEAVLTNTLSFLSEKFRRCGIEVVKQFEPVASVNGDFERLQQLFLNLFLNAADAMPEGGRLEVSLAPHPNDEVEVRVADSGVGIPDPKLPRVFDPFFTTKPAGEGSGLGLAVVHGIVTEHSGTIRVTSSEGQGTEFRLLFPRHPQQTGSDG